MQATDRLYQLYLEHYRRLEQDFAHVQHWYAAADLTAVGIKKLDQQEFEAELKRLEATPHQLQNWLLRILRGQQYDDVARYC